MQHLYVCVYDDSRLLWFETLKILIKWDTPQSRHTPCDVIQEIRFVLRDMQHLFVCVYDDSRHVWFETLKKLIKWDTPQSRHTPCDVIQATWLFFLWHAAFVCVCLWRLAIRSSHDTGWRRPIRSLIFIGHFPQKWPLISGSFVCLCLWWLETLLIRVSPKLQIISHKRATKYRSLLRGNDL